MTRTIQLLAQSLAAIFVCVTRVSSTPSVEDHFDSQLSRELWRFDKLAPGAARHQDVYVRRGAGALMITIRPGDPSPEKSADETERDEIQEADRYNSELEDFFEYRFSIYVPDDFPVVRTRLVIAQWKQDSGGRDVKVDTPLIALRYVGGELYVTAQQGIEKRIIGRFGGDIRGKWIDVIAQIRHSLSRGLVRVKVGDQLIAENSGPTAYGEELGYSPRPRFYFKMGLYRDDMQLPMTIYFDEYSKERIEERSGINRPNQALQHNDPSCHAPCVRTCRASWGRG